MARYTVLRLLIFFGFLLLFWLVGLRDNRVLLLGAGRPRLGRGLLRPAGRHA